MLDSFKMLVVKMTTIGDKRKAPSEKMKTFARLPTKHENSISRHESIIVIYSTFVIVLAALVALSAASTNEPTTQPENHHLDTNSSNKNNHQREPKQLEHPDQNGFQLHDLYSMSLDQQRDQPSRNVASLGNQNPAMPLSESAPTQSNLQSANFNGSAASTSSSTRTSNRTAPLECPNGLLTFELSTGFIYKPSGPDDTLSMMPSTLQLTDCLEYCLHNSSCLAINFEMGLCVLLATSAKQNQQNLHSSQFPVFTIYAEKKCLLTEPSQAKYRRRCQRAWTFERVAGYEMKIKPRRRLKLATKELCMDACLVEREFACRSANWYKQTGECSLSDQDRHSVSQSEAGDQQIKASLSNFYGPQNVSDIFGSNEHQQRSMLTNQQGSMESLQRLYSGQQVPLPASPMDRSRLNGQLDPTAKLATTQTESNQNNRRLAPFKQLFYRTHSAGQTTGSGTRSGRQSSSQMASLHQPSAAAAEANPNSNQEAPTERQADWAMQQHYLDLPANTNVDYLENNCIYEPNKLCEFRKIQNRILKTVDSIYQEVATLDECRQKCLNAPYRCYSFDYGDTSERVCRTSHLDQASLLSVNEPYLEVVGAITYELAACFNVSIQCRAKGMVAMVSSSKSFNGKIYAKSRPTSCVNDVTNSLQFELSMKYHDESCDVRASSNQQQGVFSNDIVIQHHDRIVTTQDVGLSVYCQYDLGNRSVTNNVDLAIERLPDGPMESKQQTGVGGQQQTGNQSSGPLTITGLATTVVRSPNVTMRITNMNGQPVTSATVGDRLALLFEIKEKTSPFGILVREIVAMDGRQLASGQNNLNSSNWTTNGAGSGAHQNGSSQLSHIYHQYANDEELTSLASNSSLIEATNSIQFLDHDGCPTDANLMGPLVRMDPQGHRLLAPFDAFKFPASDMVFFRAVVSSCVAECKPAVCAGPQSGPPLSSSSSSFRQPELAPPSYGDLFSPTPPDDVVATTRNMPTTTNNQQQPSGITEQPGRSMTTVTSVASSTTMPPSSSTTPTTTTTTVASVVSTVTPSRQQQQQQYQQQQQQQPARSSSTLAPYEPSRTTKLHNQQEQQQQQSDSNSGDLLTTVPGYNVHSQTDQQQAASTATTSRLDMAQTQSATTSGLQLLDSTLSRDALNEPNALIGQDQSMVINMTNNHNLGRPSPRPMTSTTLRAESEQFESDLHGRDKPLQQQQLSTSGQSERRPALPPPAKLDPLTAQERQAILDLLSGHEKSSLLSSSGQPSSSSLVDEQIITSGLMKLYPILESFRHGNSRSRELSNTNSLGNQTSQGVLQEIKALISDQFHEMDRQNNEHNNPPMGNESLGSNRAGTTMGQQQNKIKRSSAEFVPIAAPSQEFVELINRTLIDYIIAEELKSTLLTQMLMDEARATTAPELGADLEQSPRLSSPNRKEGRNLANDLDDNQELQSREFPAELLDKFFTTLNWPLKRGDKEARGMGLTFEQVARLVKAQFDQELAGKIQRILKLLDESKTLNKAQHQQQRTKRATSEDELRRSSSYVYMSQPQFANWRHSNGFKFTNGHVELYHTNELHRIRRQAPMFEGFETHPQASEGNQLAQPKYEVEEMIVQSIKIVDRLQFDDDVQKQRQQLATNGPIKDNKSATAWRRRPSKKQARDNDTPQANRQLGDEDSMADDDASERPSDSGHQPIKSRLSAINILLVAMCFIFIQISMVLLCLINWNGQRRRQTRRSLFADLAPFKTVDRSTISSSMTYSDCSNYR